ncbi:M48 family metalloprotease [Bacillus thuringiensis]|uniref:M48 family metalloprotease n=1 Tax=Bacillus thuringiensis TaxID=1428 RepID=UPI001F553771|nr:M48 family metalloprotease [Bacillus thuringiensis]
MTVCLTKGGLKTANEEELAGILAHELGHLKYGDSKCSVMARTLNTVTTWILVAMATVCFIESYADCGCISGFCSGRIKRYASGFTSSCGFIISSGRIRIGAGLLSF